MLKRGLLSPSSNSATVVLGVKVSLELNNIIENLAIQETKGNKSEMIRLLITEAISKRGNDENLINEMAKNEF